MNEFLEKNLHQLNSIQFLNIFPREESSKKTLKINRGR